MSATPQPKVPWRELTQTVLVPNLVHGAGQGAAVPVLPLAAVALTGSSAAAAVVAAMPTLGQLALTLPAGWVVARFGERRAMLASTVVTAAGGLLAYAGSRLWTLIAAALLIGGGAAVFTMARHAWVTVAVAAQVRGRALATLGGSTRLGLLAGPFITAAALHLTGDVNSGFLVVAGVSVVLAVLVALVRLPEIRFPGTRFPGTRSPIDAGPGRQTFRVLWERRDVLLTLAPVMSVISTMRTTKRILVPLVGAAVGLDEVTVALIVGVSYGLDFSLFYLGGVVTDRWGRLAVALPSLLAFAVSHLALALATQLPEALWWYLGGVATMALANGISGGVVPTVGSDLADPRSPAAFLAGWRLSTEVLPAAAPLAIAAVAGAVSLSAACAAVAVLAAADAALLPAAYRAINDRTRLSP